MPLYKLADFDPDYKETFGGDDIKSLSLYTEGGERIGSVSDALVDPEGRFRYLVIDSDFNSTGKKILLPIGLSHIDYNAHRVYVDGLSRHQVEQLPEYKESMTVDYDYEEQVRRAYRPTSDNLTHSRDSYDYQHDPSLYNLNEQKHQTFKLYEERLIANKNRVKTGEVAVGKHIETETARVAIPLEKERVIIERVTPTETVVDPSTLKFQEGEVARVEVYEETPDIRKEAFVREEVRVRKVVEQETVERQETIRREELDVQTQGDLPIDSV
ncbi:DUF2382 domain-containing protein [Aetokthonos hydrillicola Thurmond2011]|jgi:uncharacterized protein (TIGR02271 family)|uniref:DUF2382 domain-containing protein n=1 Tax=Aetokthonos hydrillicola Thurmond2011 TaxID=2712845 RepID=A0AAP5I9M6_9CYAN|nr:DUF2382 domain-containing protein [Aetokthonos hydrillicola]MBO3457832.1 DUF2382 domain-containing protein [Aetokthonos hydrillicola CCALA 1050]MBW4588310.1 DUF2382 domain-containing protein [Aetokthonos hydrillicola CCALA 1050]MDR9897209.1 DUF2382 domain-containing protein [Aetokthonos hydrillicola Thurmond2011]